jgi:5-methylcytosine-specific restriction enzyme subunit McrC
MEVSEMICEGLTPSEEGSGSRFRGILRDEKALRALFQRFVYNFFRQEQQVFAVSADTYNWAGKRVGREGDIGLPRMHTDVVLRAPGRTVVLDTKFTPQPFSTFRGSTTVRPSHIYQIFAYMVNMCAREPAGTRVEGILLYPSTDAAGFDLQWHVSDMPLRVTSVNLASEWPSLKESLLKLPASTA